MSFLQMYSGIFCWIIALVFTVGGVFFIIYGLKHRDGLVISKKYTLKFMENVESKYEKST